MSAGTRMVVTVGTSLFSSASWRVEEPFASLPGYRRWAGELIENPSERRTAARQTPRHIEAVLREQPEEALAAFDDGGPALRYSAELSTLLLWQGREGSRALGPFLNERYDRVDLVAPCDRNDLAWLAAAHLRAVLAERLGVERVRVVEAITSPAIKDRVRQLRGYLDTMAAETDRADLVVSGGYKVYAMVAAALAVAGERRWQVIYVHEDSARELIVQDGKSLAFRDGSVPLLADADSL